MASIEVGDVRVFRQKVVETAAFLNKKRRCFSPSQQKEQMRTAVVMVVMNRLQLHQRHHWCQSHQVNGATTAVLVVKNRQP